MTVISTNPVDDSVVGEVADTSPEELRAVLTKAASATPVTASAGAADRAAWMRAVADALDRRAEELVELADRETALGTPRLVGELARTTGQLRFLAAHAETAEPFRPTLDTPDPQWVPTPRPDLRSLRVAVGPVLVFAAGNFPFAFSVAGGDTAGAWAAGCPVVVKSHPGHPLLSVAVADTIDAALAASGAPSGMFALIHGLHTGVAALSAPEIAAGAFTGSVSGGRALHAIAAGRQTPIPFFAEMGSVNPVVVTERASRERVEEIAAGLRTSFLLGAGQFCTKPGLILIPADSELPDRLAALIADLPAPVMLNLGMRDRHRSLLRDFLSHESVQLSATGREPVGQTGAHERISVAATTARALLADVDALTEEHFGPSTVFVTYTSTEELHDVLAALPGSLTGSVQRGTGEDVADLVGELAARVGRVLVDDWPTGVAVSWAQFHGGPYPASTDSRHTSVGSASIGRFLRTVAYQNMPQDALPPWLRDANPDAVLRRINGTLTTDPVRP
ncbi:aldehyde dehydrogenase family protein [Embleya scabrispora]|uniref:aldehyde dehydrogenase family protein n=1 Tax=Embleya scabrispora TaxID=159449 RepID=UPI0003604E99|nr:aldehyde dehydrogenase family protein [Embleya scabrispora]MYS81077.1 aldehyde dehydrogenase family protein [Streptomyces sp. SID5474]